MCIKVTVLHWLQYSPLGFGCSVCYPEAAGDRRQFCFGRGATLLKKLIRLTKMSSSSPFPAAPTSQATTVGVHPKPMEKPRPSDKNVSIFPNAPRTCTHRQLNSNLAPNSGTSELKNTVLSHTASI